jgi:hypothetical protein
VIWWAIHSAVGLAVTVSDSCACRKLNPAVLMMKSAEDRPRCDLPVPVDRPMGRRILTQRQMRPEFVVIADVGCKDLAQMGFAKDDDVIRDIPDGSSRSVSPHAHSAKATVEPSGDLRCPWQKAAW